MHEHKKANSIPIWIVVLISAGVSLVIAALVSLAFQIPSLLAMRPRPAPDMVGLTVEEAEEETAKLKLLILAVGEEPSDFDEGVIIEQTPAAGEHIRSRQVVKVVLSSGRPQVKVPDLAGLDLVHATEMLQAAGLFVSDVVSRSDTVPEDLVIGTDPPQGTKIEKGSKLTLFVSLGPELIEVPKVRAKKLSSAKQILEEAGFTVGEVTYQVTGEYYRGTVMKQTPEAGKMAPRGSKINLVVAGVLR